MTVARGAAVDAAGFAEWFEARRERIVADLCELVAIVSPMPHEERCHPWVRARIERLGGRTELIRPSAELEAHPAFTQTGHAPRPVLRAAFGGLSTAPAAVLFSAHLDVVPASEEAFPNAYHPQVRGETVVGRGAADTKNNIVMLLAALEFLTDNDALPPDGVLVDFVPEEEIGGNGALLAVLGGIRAARVVVLEPTGLAVHHGHRGCMSCTMRIDGRGTHMGSDAPAVSAIELAADVIVALRDYEEVLRSRALELADMTGWRRPAHVNVGAIQGGEWHGSTAARCRLELNVGFPPGMTADQVRDELRGYVEHVVGAPGGSAQLCFNGLHNGAYAMPADALVETLRGACTRHDVERDVPGVWNVSCDARTYHDHGVGPTVIFGSGTLEAAHSDCEHVRIDELRLGAAVLAEFLASCA